MTDTQHNALERATGFMRHDGLCAAIGGYGYCDCGMEAARDALRPVPLADEQMEERARALLADLVEAEEMAGGARPVSALGKTTADYIRDSQGARVTAWQAIRVAMAIAREVATQPAESGAAAMRERAARVADERYDRMLPANEIEGEDRYWIGGRDAAYLIAAAIRSLPLKAGQEGEGR